MIISAPTGSGKTMCLELGILGMLAAEIDMDGRLAHSPGTTKAVYIAPTRSLVQEKSRDWANRLGRLGLVVREITGDSEHDDVQALDEVDVMCMTPEKFDALTRRSRRSGCIRYFSEVRT